MLHIHTKFLRQYYIQQRIMLLLGYCYHTNNQSLLQSLNLELIIYIISLLALPNNNDITLIKASGWNACVENYKYSCITVCHPAKIMRTFVPPALTWILSFMDTNTMFEPNWLEFKNKAPYWALDFEARNLANCSVEQIKFALRHRSWLFMIAELPIWCHGSRWFVKDKARFPATQLMVYQCECSTNFVQSQLEKLFGKQNMSRFCLVKAVDKQNSITQVFISADSGIIRALHDDILFGAFHAFNDDIRITKLNEHKPGFQLAI